MNNKTLIILSVIIGILLSIPVMIIILFFLETYIIESTIVIVILMALAFGLFRQCFELKVTNDIKKLYETTDKIIDNQLKFIELDEFRHPSSELADTDEYYEKYKPDVI